MIIIISKAMSAPIIPIVMWLREDPAKLWITLKKKYKFAALQHKLTLMSILLASKME